MNFSEIVALLADALPALFAGSVVGFLLNLTGIGGGVIAIPVLMVFFDMGASLAVGTAGFFITFTKIFSSLAHAKINNIAYRASFLFLLGAVPGVLVSGGLVAWLFNQTSVQQRELIDEVIKWLVFSMIFLSVVLIFSSRFRSSNKETRPKSSKPLSMASAGSVVGIAMGCTGIGGGILVIPALMKFTAEDTKVVVGSSIFISLMITFAMSLVYSKGGLVDYAFAVSMICGSFLGIAPAHFFGKKMSEGFLQNLVIVVIIASAVLMTFSP